MPQKKSRQPGKSPLTGETVRRLLFVNHPIPMFIYDLETLKFLDVNNSGLEKYGYTQEELLRLTIKDIHAAEGSGEQRHLLKNGEAMDVEVTSHPFEFEGQKAVLAITRDITAHKRDEETLKRHNELLSTLLENLTIGVFMVEAPSGKPLIANETAMKLLGRGILPNASRKNLSEVYRARKQGSQEPYPVEEMPIVRGMHGESAHIDDMIVERPDGSEVHLEIFGSPIKNASGETWASLVSFHDITERKQIEEALHESKLNAERYLNIAAEIIISLDCDGNITHLNESGHLLLGYGTTELIGKNWFDACVAEEERGEVHFFFEMMKSGEIREMESHEYRVVTKSGERKTILWHNTILRDQNDGFVGTLGSGEDITQRMEMEKALRIALAKYKTLFECFPLGITISNEAGDILETNPIAEKLLAVPRDKHTQRSIDGSEWLIIRPDGSPMPTDEYASVRALKEKRLVENVEMGIIKPDHTTTWISVNAAPLPLEGHGVVIAYGDITERKWVEKALRESEARNRALVDAMPDLIFVQNREGIYIDYHANKSQLLAAPPQAFLGHPPHDVLPPDLADILQSKIDLAFQTGHIQTHEYALELANGRHYFEARINTYGENRVLSVVRDITERKQAEEALESANMELKAALVREKQLANTDMLTGVNNRRNLYDLAAQEFEIAARYRQPLSMILFDLDHFKKVNDTFGHALGDQILVQVTQAARAELRSADSIGRYGGEEFVILLPMTNAQQAYSLAERIRERAAQICMPTPIGNATVTLSIGIVEMKQGAGQGESVDTMIRRADQAMYEAKQGGRNCSVIFNPNSVTNVPKGKIQ